MTERLLTPVDVAEWAQVSERTVRRAIARGDLPAGRAGGQLRIDPNAARAWVFGGAPTAAVVSLPTQSEQGGSP